MVATALIWVRAFWEAWTHRHDIACDRCGRYEFVYSNATVYDDDEQLRKALQICTSCGQRWIVIVGSHDKTQLGLRTRIVNGWAQCPNHRERMLSKDAAVGPMWITPYYAREDGTYRCQGFPCQESVTPMDTAPLGSDGSLTHLMQLRPNAKLFHRTRMFGGKHVTYYGMGVSQ